MRMVTMVANLLRTLYLMIGIALTTARTDRNLCPPNCRFAADDTFICTFQNTTDYSAFLNLSYKTVSLICIITGSFEEDLVDFSQLKLLENLTLESAKNYSTYQEAADEKALTTFRREDLFQNLTSLRSLSIRLVLTSFNSSLLASLQQLKALSFCHTYMFDFSDFVDIVREAGKSLHILQEFRMIAAQTLITPDTMIKLRDHMYENLQNLSLKVLDLTENKAVLLQNGLTTYLPGLEVFRVGASQLMIFENTYHSLTCNLAELIMHVNLREFELSYPRKVPGGVFASTDNQKQKPKGDRLLECIQHLYTNSDICDLADCICEGLAHVPCQPYGKTVQLKDLIQPPYRLGEPWTICIPTPPSLENFVFRNYQSVVVEHNTNYCFNPSNMSNRIKHVDVSYNDLKYESSPKIGVTGLRQLRSLNIQGNGLVISGETKTLTDVPLLEVLLLGHNDVSAIGQSELDLFRLRNLKILDLENCGIHQMPANSLENLTQLAVLNLSMNMLSAFDVNVGDLKQLKLLNLSHNRITTLGMGVTSQLDALTNRNASIALDISGNPLTCFCDNIEFVQWLKSTRVQFAQKDVTMCTHPTLPVVSPWKVDVNALYRQCIHFDAIISSTLSAVGMALLLAVIFVLYRRRWRIRYWLYAARESWRQSRGAGESTPLLTPEYIYDAFVAYSSHGEERSWVHTTLREKLENEHGLKLCMYHRDFKVGRDLAETIVEGINSSNKTLVILSPDFLNSGWCEFEVRMANEKVISERRDSLVIVIFKRLDQAGTRLPKMLTRMMEKKIYIEWTDDPDGQSLFWRRLVDSIRSGASYDAYNDLPAMN